jgi:23S rRNA pseudouridine1911/1915/1917 synthase
MRFVLLSDAGPEPAAPLSFGVVHEDTDLLAADKPAGLPVHPNARYLEHTFTALARAAYPDRKIDPAHRLDRETSGLLACGCHPAATRALKIAFARGQVRKTYLALAQGTVAEERFTVDAALRLTGASGVRVRMHVAADGLPARTDFAVLERRRAPGGAAIALLACRPHTGRQHQIRAHLHHAGLALVGDKIYGRDEMIFDRYTRGELTAEDRATLGLPRQALHAWKLTLPHPASGELLSLEAPLAADLQRFWDGLERQPVPPSPVAR